ncbi:hypothetical protein NPX13_g7829 [Xylaria arbuscula]|uniref:Uncharacterized protein n=1 Tax=Xylaria arbuscula TaxID=114810 RepID=A0A9W8TKE4_9PEZI|nr:hypothetical protein NPX13_g7829 [Xylaria arbuscula]
MAITEASLGLLGSLPSILLLSIALPLIVIAYYGAVWAYNIWLHPLSKYPGPLLARASPLWMVISYLHGKTPTELLKLHERYGPVVRTGPNELSYINTSQWKEIYGFKSNGQTEFVKDPQYHAAIKPNTSILNSNAQYHGYLRKLLAHGFSEKSLREQESVLKSFIDTLFRRLNEESRNGEQPVDIQRWYNFVSFDIIGYLTFGESFNCLTTGTFHTWVSIFFSIAKNFAYGQMSARLPYLIRGPFKRYFVPAKVTGDVVTLAALNEEKTNHRIENSPPVPDFMDKLVDAYKSGKLSDESLKENTQVLVAAGSETTATSLAGKPIGHPLL